MFGRRKQKKKQRNLADVDIDRNEGTMYLIREYRTEGTDRTVAMYVSKDSAERALAMILKNIKKINRNDYVVETFNYVEHKNSLVGK